MSKVVVMREPVGFKMLYSFEKEHGFPRFFEFFLSKKIIAVVF